MEVYDNETPVYGDKKCNAHLNAIGDALYVIGGKWKLRIIIALLHGKRRFNELQRMIKGISSKVLAAELKDLELNGFVRRTVLTEAAIAVEYEATEYSSTLHHVLSALSEWGIMHRENIKKGLRHMAKKEGYAN